MTIKKNVFFVLLLNIALMSCEAQNSDNPIDYYSNSTIFKVDTIIQDVLICGNKFSIKILRDQVDEQLNPFLEEDEPSFRQSPMTVIFINNTDGKVVYLKKFDSEPNDYPYLNYSFYKSQDQSLNTNGKLYLLLNKNFGGSGSISNRYLIDYKDNKICFSHLFESSGELTYILYNKNDNEIIVLDGIWNTKEDESHFANHRYKIKKYSYTDGRFLEIEIGKTKFKYSSLDENKSNLEILKDIKTKEPLLLIDLKLSNY